MNPTSSNSSAKSSMGQWNWAAIMQDMGTAWRLFWNPKVPTMLKLLLPVAALIYWIVPIDLIPGIPLDDIAILILALRLFVQLAPQDAVNQSQARHSSPTDAPPDDENTIDTTWRVIDADK